MMCEFCKKDRLIRAYIDDKPCCFDCYPIITGRKA